MTFVHTFLPGVPLHRLPFTSGRATVLPADPLPKAKISRSLCSRDPKNGYPWRQDRMEFTPRPPVLGALPPGQYFLTSSTSCISSYFLYMYIVYVSHPNIEL